MNDENLLYWFVNNVKYGELSWSDEGFSFRYTSKASFPLSLTMPLSQKDFIAKKGVFLPFEMNLPYVQNCSENDEYDLSSDKAIFDFLLREGGLTIGAKSLANAHKERLVADFDKMIFSDDKHLFDKIKRTYKQVSFVSGRQPKLLLALQNSSENRIREFVVKSWCEKTPELGFNEFFGLRAYHHAGIPIPKVFLSHDRTMIFIERFDQEGDQELLFDDMGVLLGKKSSQRYEGSYEDIAKILKSIFKGHERKEVLRRFFAMIVMNYFLKNSDAHLKNFGILYHIREDRYSFAPAYDITTPVIYGEENRPALLFCGKRSWGKKSSYFAFGKSVCKLSMKEITEVIDECKTGIFLAQKELELMMKIHPECVSVGGALLEMWHDEFES